MLDFLGDLKRTHMCGELRASDAGSKVVLMGWVNKRRDLGNLIFLDLRDRSGITQVVITADAGVEVHDRTRHSWYRLWGSQSFHGGRKDTKRSRFVRRIRCCRQRLQLFRPASASNC